MSCGRHNINNWLLNPLPKAERLCTAAFRYFWAGPFPVETSHASNFPCEAVSLGQCQAANFFHYLQVHLADHTLSFMLRCCVCWCSRMSLQILNAENGENGGSIKDDLAAEDCGFFFALPEPTGRPSILRLSQKENLPPKNVGKATKVNFCFCTTFVVSPFIIPAAECLYYLVLEKYCAHVLPFFSHPFLKGNLSNSSKRSSHSKNPESCYDRQTSDCFCAWRLPWRCGGWCFICTLWCWVSTQSTASCVTHVGHAQVNFSYFSPI